MTLQDAIHAALITQGFTGHVSDMLLAFYKAGGATSNDISTAQHQYLVAQGATSAQVNNMWFEVLRAAGYTGSLTDMLYAFWVAGGSFLGPELITAFTNGTTSPLSTLITSGVSISSGVALAGTGCVSNPSLPVLTGDKFKLRISAVSINAFSGAGLRIAIANEPSGNALLLSNSELVKVSVVNLECVLIITGDDGVSFLQLGTNGISTVDFAAISVSLKQML